MVAKHSSLPVYSDNLCPRGCHAVTIESQRKKRVVPASRSRKYGDGRTFPTMSEPTSLGNVPY